VKTEAAPGSAWEARLRWGSRRLTAEVLDGRGRTTLSLGDGPDDDVTVGSPARTRFEWRPDGLAVLFSAGVEGELSAHGDHARTFSELLQRGSIAERPEGFELLLRPGDVLTIRIGTLIAEVRQARGRFPRLPIDARALIFVALALLAVGTILASVMAPPELPVRWLRRQPPPAQQR